MGSNPTRAMEAMELVAYTGRPKPLFWVENLLCRAVLTGKPVTIVASSREQAERTFAAAQSLINGRDPNGAVPG